MWPLRRNVQYNKRYFFREVFCVVLIAHLILVGFLFVSNIGKFHQERFVLTPHHEQTTVVFMPLQKRVQHTSPSSNGLRKQGAQKILSYHDYEKKLAAKKLTKEKYQNSLKKAIKSSSAEQLVTPSALVVTSIQEKSPTMVLQNIDTKQELAKNKILAEQAKKKAEAALKAKKIADLAKAKAAQQKALAIAKTAALDKQKKATALANKLNAEKVAKKKAEDERKRLEQEKQKLAEQQRKEADDQAKLAIEKAKKQAELTAEKPVLPSIDKKEQEAVEKIIQQVLEQKNVDIAESVVNTVTNIVNQQLTEQVVKEPVALNEIPVRSLSTDQDHYSSEYDAYDLDHISFIGSRDLEMMQIKEQIQMEIVKYYKPPVGIAKTAVCELLIVIGRDSKATQVQVKKSSGSMANDICARAALFKVQFPKEIIGKEITVALGQ